MSTWGEQAPLALKKGTVRGRWWHIPRMAELQWFKLTFPRDRRCDPWPGEGPAWGLMPKLARWILHPRSRKGGACFAPCQPYTPALIRAIISSESQGSLPARAIWQVNCKLAKHFFSEPEEGMGTYEKGIQANSRGNDIMIPAGSSVNELLGVCTENLHENGERSWPPQSRWEFCHHQGGGRFCAVINFVLVPHFPEWPSRMWCSDTAGCMHSACCLARLASLHGCQVLGSLAHVQCCCQTPQPSALQTLLWSTVSTTPQRGFEPRLEMVTLQQAPYPLLPLLSVEKFREVCLSRVRKAGILTRSVL